MRLSVRPVGAHGPTPRASRVFLHIGAPVTGSTYLRGTLHRSRRQLTRFGILYPSSHVAGAGHLEAVLDVLGLADSDHHGTTGAWDRLTQCARDWRRGTVVVSHELLADADEHQVERVMSGFGGAEVHVVYAARALALQLPLAWQEWVRNGGTTPFESYVDQVTGRGPHRPARVFWRSHELPAVLHRWSAFVPPGRVHVLTVPAGPDQEQVLWSRFAHTVGIDPARVRPAVPPEPGPLSLAAAEAVRLLNQATGRGPSPAVLAAAAGVPGHTPCLSPAHLERLRVEQERTVDAVADGGYDLVGDLAELRAEDRAGDPTRLVAPDAAVLHAQTQLLARLDAEGPADRSRRAQLMRVR